MSEPIYDQHIDLSIICITYNHQEYIRDAIEGVLSQRTSFSFEIIVHDDASTDNTASIIKEYTKKSNSIIPILQDRNQVSQGIPVVKNLFRRARGRYIAFLEGDDCWIDPEKLQTEYSWLEAHPDYSACLHNAFVIDYRYGAIYYSENPDKDKDKLLDDIVIEGGGVINPTASFMFRRELVDRMRYKGPVGDHFWFLACALSGKIRWFSKPMSIYRVGTPGSFTDRYLHRTLAQTRQYMERYINALNEVELDAGEGHEKAFQQRKNIQISSFYNESCALLPIQELKRLPYNFRYKLMMKKIVLETMPLSIVKRIQRKKVLHKLKRRKLLISRQLGEEVTKQDIMKLIYDNEK